MNNVKYNVRYYPTGMAKKMSDFMVMCDFGLERVVCEEVFEIQTTTKINKTYIKKMEKALVEAIEKTGGEVVSIENIGHGVICNS